MDVKILGALVGLAFGIVLVWFGPGKAFAVAAFVILGWVIGKILARELDVVGYLEWVSRRPRR